MNFTHKTVSEIKKLFPNCKNEIIIINDYNSGDFLV